ncbi:hypothetical protein ACHAWT_004933 [Skeletonema menzelii]|eukprot:scaffold1148_cov148-Skeletonema_menzelii.AAC.6
MATCVSSESNPFTPSPSFTLKPRGEKCSNSASHYGALRLAPSFGRGLRIRSSFDGQDPTMFDDAHAFEDQTEPPSMAIEPPTWAVKANGEARLEPVGLTASTHDSMDLSSNPCFQVGRSPSSDMQLVHPTASRKHALIFHHPNGSCYVVDCGSSHGTFVNGVRVASPSLQQGSDQATAVPHRVRKGSLIRFGGTGAPTFVLRSFTTSLEVLVAELNTGKTTNHNSSCIVPAVVGSHSPTKSDRPAKGEQPSLSPTLSPTKPTIDKERKLQASSPETALVALNTRVNALGGGASLSDRNFLIAKEAAFKFATAPDERDQIDSCLLGKRSRFNSDVGFDTPSFDRVKRVRSASFPASFPVIQSPNSACSITKIQEDDARSRELTQTPLIFHHRALTSSILDLHTLDGTEERQPKVKFQEEVEIFYPASVTPDEALGSFDRLVTPNLESMIL